MYELLMFQKHFLHLSGTREFSPLTEEQQWKLVLVPVKILPFRTSALDYRILFLLAPVERNRSPSCGFGAPVSLGGNWDGRF